MQSANTPVPRRWKLEIAKIAIAYCPQGQGHVSADDEGEQTTAWAPRKQVPLHGRGWVGNEIEAIATVELALGTLRTGRPAWNGDIHS